MSGYRVPDKLSLPPEAIAALEADGRTKITRPLSDKEILIIRKIAARTLFGPSMRPTFKQQILTFSSFAAIKTSWVATYWQKIQRMKA